MRRLLLRYYTWRYRRYALGHVPGDLRGEFVLALVEAVALQLAVVRLELLRRWWGALLRA